jgi:hypothetical protein
MRDALAGHDLVPGEPRSTIVHGVSLGLRHGVVTALIGPNGSGKSTGPPRAMDLTGTTDMVDRPLDQPAGNGGVGDRGLLLALGGGDHADVAPGATPHKRV